MKTCGDEAGEPVPRVLLQALEMRGKLSGLDHRQMVCKSEVFGSQTRYRGNESPPWRRHRP